MPPTTHTTSGSGSLAKTTTLSKVGFKNFELLVLAADIPVLLACLHESPESRQQIEVLEGLSKSQEGALKVCFLDPACIGVFAGRLELAGTPTFLIFDGGNELDRMHGRADRETLTAFVSRAFPPVSRG